MADLIACELRSQDDLLRAAVDRFAGAFGCLLILGDNVLFPTKDIRNVEFQFLGGDGRVVPFDLLAARVATTTGGVGQVDRLYTDGGWSGRCAHSPDAPGFRSYLVSLVITGGRPKGLRVRLSEAGGDDCDVWLTSSGGDLVRGAAAGTEWRRWEIPA